MASRQNIHWWALNLFSFTGSEVSGGLLDINSVPRVLSHLPHPLFPEILCSHVRNVPPISDFLVRGYSCLLSNSLQILLLCVPSHKGHKETCLHAWGECGPWTFDLRHNFSLICLLTNSRNIKKIHLVCNYICFDRYIYSIKKFPLFKKISFGSNQVKSPKRVNDWRTTKGKEKIAWIRIFSLEKDIDYPMDSWFSSSFSST